MNNQKRFLAFIIASASILSAHGETKEELKEQVATIINLNDFLCAKVLDIRPLEVRPNVYEVKCIEYSGGSGTKTYIFDASKGIAWIP
jgi:hypothetical protein